MAWCGRARHGLVWGLMAKTNRKDENNVQRNFNRAGREKVA